MQHSLVRTVRVPLSRRARPSSSTRSATCRALRGARARAGTTRRSRTSTADLLLVTHEHLDHNGVEVVGGDPVMMRSTAGTLRVADRRGRRRSPPSTTTSPGTSAGRTRSSSSRSTACGSPTSATSASAALRPEQLAAIGEVDVLLVPSAAARRSAASRRGRLVARSRRGSWCRCTTGRERIDFLEPPDEFIEALGMPSRRSRRARSRSTRSKASCCSRRRPPARWFCVLDREPAVLSRGGGRCLLDRFFASVVVALGVASIVDLPASSCFVHANRRRFSKRRGAGAPRRGQRSRSSRKVDLFSRHVGDNDGSEFRWSAIQLMRLLWHE